MTNRFMPETIRIADSDRYGEPTAFINPETMEAAFMEMWEMTAADAHELAELPETQSNIYHASLVQIGPRENSAIYAANGRYYYVSEFEDGIGSAEMTATENNTRYWVCASTYHGFDESLQNNGDTVRITTIPIYTDEEQQTICCDWGCSQDGPFDSLEEAREAMVALYGPCRQLDYKGSEYRYFVKEAWAVHQYYILTKEQAEEILDYYPLPETTDDEIKEEAAAIFFWLHDEGDHYDQEDIEEILFERRERAREEVEEED